MFALIARSLSPRSLSPRSLSTQTDGLLKTTWEKYLASGRGSERLFAALDENGDGSISPAEVERLVGVVGDEFVRPEALAALRAAASDHELSLDDLRTWLIKATRASGACLSTNPRLRAAYEARPELGPRSKGAAAVAPPRGGGGGGGGAHAWNKHTMSQALRRMQYAVRGEVVMKADALAEAGREITYTNVGNPHAVGQRPLTFFRQVLALCDLPASEGVDHAAAAALFPRDALERAREVRAAIGAAGTGAYTNSQGVAAFRRDVAGFLEARDGHAAHAGDIFLSNGASSAIGNVLTALIASDTDAVMIPIPQYPIYSALIALGGGRQVGYELDEANGWSIDEAELVRQYEKASASGLNVRALALINPGNPTGQVLSADAVLAVCRFCAARGIVLLADEVYQRNVYADGARFTSAKKAALDGGVGGELELVSFHSTSKGLIGECGRRGGYMELHNIDADVHAQLYKLASAGLCSGVAGQVMTSLMVRPPAPGDDSHAAHAAEEAAILASLRSNAALLVDGLNAIPGITCNAAEGAMYAFPRVEMPARALAAAADASMSVDTLYALSLLEQTGICVVPASGFGQAAGRAGFRTTFLPPEAQLRTAVSRFAEHHAAFCAEYA